MDEDDKEDDEDEGEEAGAAPHQDGQAVPDRKAWSSSSGFSKNVFIPLMAFYTWVIKCANCT